MQLIDNKSDRIIEFDWQTDEMEYEDGVSPNGVYPYDPTNRTIEIEELPFSIFEYLRQLNIGRIFIRPEFQRNQVWTVVQKSQFIESILLGFPVPPFYLNQTKENKLLVIDGLQRTLALNEFFLGKFKLTGLGAVPLYNGKTFAELPEVLQAKLEHKKIIIFSLKPSTPTTVIYDLFKRINTGGTQLNRQEVRYGLFYGKSTRLLEELSQLTEFREAINDGLSPKRMKDREVVLRYIAFRWSNIVESYNGDLSAFVENMMRELNHSSDEKIEEIRSDFIRTMTWAKCICEDDAFHISNNSNSPSFGSINIAIMESVCRAISLCADEFLEKHLIQIGRNYQELIGNQNYLQAVTKSTASKTNVVKRFAMASEILSKIEP